MTTIEAILIFLAVLLASFGLIVLAGVIKTKSVPDGIIAIKDDGEKLKANFILCLPLEEFLNRSKVTFEVQKLDDSQEIQEP